MNARRVRRDLLVSVLAGFAAAAVAGLLCDVLGGPVLLGVPVLLGGPAAAVAGLIGMLVCAYRLDRR